MVDMVKHPSLAPLVFSGSVKKCEVWDCHSGRQFPSDLPIPEAFLELFSEICIMNCSRLLY